MSRTPGFIGNAVPSNGAYRSHSSNRSSAPARLGNSTRRYDNNSGNRATEHPVPQSPTPNADAVAMFGVPFHETGIYPFDDGYVPQWYRSIRRPLETLRPETVAGLPGRYLKPEHTVHPGTLLLTGNGRTYRMYLYLGYQAWYPLYEDHPVVPGANANSRAAIARLIHGLHAYPDDLLVAGCAMRSVAAFMRVDTSWSELQKNSYFKVCNALTNFQFIDSLKALLAGETPKNRLTQIVAAGPFPLAIISWLENPDAFDDWLDLVSPALPGLAGLEQFTGALDEALDNPDADLDPDNDPAVVEIGRQPTHNRRRIVVLDDDQPDSNAESDPFSD